MQTLRRSAFRVLALLPFALLSAPACGGKSFNADGGGASGSAGASGAGIAGGAFAGSGATGDAAGSSSAGSASGGASNGGAANGGTANGGTANGGAANGGTSNGGTSNGGTSNGGTSNGGTSNGGTGGVSIYACVENTDCVIKPVSCCSCGSGPITDYTAINSKYVDQYNPKCTGTFCGSCPIPDYTVNDSRYYVATCQSALTVGDKVVHECRVVDLRNNTDITSCKTDADCTLRGGTACCQGCSSQAVAINASKETELESLVCPSQAFGCVACAPNTNGLGATCVSGKCSVQSTPCTVQHPCP